MSQRAALLVSAALMAVTLIAGIGLAARFISMRADVIAAPTADDDDTPQTADLDRESLYRETFDRLQQSNEALAGSFTRIAALLDEVEQLHTQNAQLREREAVYRERLAEANSRLQRQGQEAVVIPPAADDVSANAESSPRRS